MSKMLLTETLFSKADDRLELRLPKHIKSELKKEKRQSGYKTLSQYVLAIILTRQK